MRSPRLALGAALVGLMAPLAVVAGGPALATAPAPAAAASAPAAQVAPVAAPRKKPGAAKKKAGFTPPNGVLFSDPMIKGQNRNILGRVIRTIRNTAKGQTIRVVVWNYDDRPVTNALLDADRRGVHVQVVVSGSVANPNWARTQAQLNRNRKDQSFAVKCKGGCRSRTKIMHSKFITFSKVRKARNVSMFGSFNLTTPAGNRQWNDMITTRNPKIYNALVQTFQEYRRDKDIKGAYKVFNLGRNQITLFPSFGRNVIKAQLQKVRCNATASGRPTVIRIAIAGWFDAYGSDIAKQVRKLWDQGCNIRIITTLAGRGVNQILKNPRGRGPVPMRTLTYDPNNDGVPERYLHMKNIAIRGWFEGNPSANVVITGSPNWSTRAQSSDEILFRLTKANALTTAYINNTDRLFSGPWSTMRLAPSRTMLMRGASNFGGVPNLRTGENVPKWFELN